MIATLALLTATAASPVCIDPVGNTPYGSMAIRSEPAAETLRELYEAGRTWDDFLGAARARRELWLENTARAAPGEDVLARARALSGTWRFLVIAIDACSDSASTIPYLATLVSLVPNLDIRIIDSTRGRAIMEAHRTPDGRAATPTVILLSDDFKEAGCWVERPAALRAWYDEERKRASNEQLTPRKLEWYAKDNGRETLREFIGLLEAAARGQPICVRGADR